MSLCLSGRLQASRAACISGQKRRVVVCNFKEEDASATPLPSADVLAARAWISAWKERTTTAAPTASIPVVVPPSVSFEPAAPPSTPPASKASPFMPVKTYADGTVVFTAEQLKSFKK